MAGGVFSKILATIDICDRLRPALQHLTPFSICVALKRTQGGLSMSIFRIQINAAKPAVFDPSPLTVNVNDSVFWYNGDKEAHWPAPSAANPKGWLDYQIAPDGESSQISLNPPGPYTLDYVCALHPGEKGQI